MSEQMVDRDLEKALKQFQRGIILSREVVDRVLGNLAYTGWFPLASRVVSTLQERFPDDLQRWMDWVELGTCDGKRPEFHYDDLRFVYHHYEGEGINSDNSEEYRQTLRAELHPRAQQLAAEIRSIIGPGRILDRRSAQE